MDLIFQVCFLVLAQASLDVTDFLLKATADGGTLVTGALVAEEIRRRIFEATQLTASGGVGANRMLAKIASDMNKPNGQYVVPCNREAIIEFMDNLLVRKIPGIGAVTQGSLKGVNIEFCKDTVSARARQR